MNTAQIADNKLPNKYWVTVSEDYYFNSHNNCWDWVSERDNFKPKSKTLKVFKTYFKAREFFDTIELDTEDFGLHVRSKFIEDRLSGQLAEEVLYEHKEIRLEPEFSESLDFTQKEMGKRGYQFI